MSRRPVVEVMKSKPTYDDEHDYNSLLKVEMKKQLSNSADTMDGSQSFEWNWSILKNKRVTHKMAKKLRKFLILLDNESLLYFPGSFLTGRVLVDLDEDTAVTGESFFHP